MLDCGLQAVGQLAQTHRAGQTGAALEGVQGAHAASTQAGVFGLQRPVAQAGMQRGQQLQRLFFEDREQLGVNRIDRVDVVGDVRSVNVLDALPAGHAGQVGKRPQCQSAHFGPGSHGCCDGYGDGGSGGRDRCSLHSLHNLHHRHHGSNRRARFGQLIQGRRLGLADLVGIERVSGRVGPIVRRRQVRRGMRHSAQSAHQIRIRAGQEAGRKLVQQAANFQRATVEQPSLVGTATLVLLRALQRMLQRARQHRQVGVAHRRRIAGQRMRQRHRAVGHRPVQLQPPFGQLVAQTTRQLIGLVEEDVEQRDADAQRPDTLELLRIAGFARWLGLDAGGRCRRAGLGQIGQGAGRQLGQLRVGSQASCWMWRGGSSRSGAQ